MRFDFGKGVILINALLAHLELLPNFHKENPTTFRLRCIIAHKKLSLPSFRIENTATKVLHFHSENPVEFRVWRTMAHRQGFMPVFTACINIFILGRAKAHQSIKHIDACRINGETNVTS